MKQTYERFPVAFHPLIPFFFPGEWTLLGMSKTVFRSRSCIMFFRCSSMIFFFLFCKTQHYMSEGGHKQSRLGISSHRFKERTERWWSSTTYRGIIHPFYSKVESSVLYELYSWTLFVFLFLSKASHSLLIILWCVTYYFEDWINLISTVFLLRTLWSICYVLKLQHLASELHLH